MQGNETFLRITRLISIPLDEIIMHAVRSQGAGGQNVNKVATAIHLRFDIMASSLPDRVKQRLLNLSDNRISKEGIIIIKSQRSRSQDVNRQAALDRLKGLLQEATVRKKVRIATRPTLGSRIKRLEKKSRQSNLKQARNKPLVLE